MPPTKFLDQVRTIARVKHFSLSTERAYVGWIRRFILFHHKKHPKEMAETEIREFISHLAVNARISASTQTVALSALLFLYRDVLKRDLPYVDHIERAKPSKKIPVVFTRREVQAVLARLEGTHHLIASLLYGSGLRLMEAVRLRVKDIDFERGEIMVREAKGGRDQVICWDRRRPARKCARSAKMDCVSNVKKWRAGGALGAGRPRYQPIT